MHFFQQGHITVNQKKSHYGGYQLPIELTVQVISYLITPGFDYALYATVSRDWQTIIEQHTFFTINLNTTQLLAEFKQIIAQNARRKLSVRNINLDVELESYEIQARAKFETAEEHRRNNKNFVTAIQLLFNILESWPENHPGISLSINAQSPSETLTRERKRAARRDRTKDLLNRRFERSYLQFSEKDLVGLPAVQAVTALSAGIMGNRLILPASCAMIASKLPRLHSVNFFLSDNEKRDKSLRKQNRNGKAIVNLDRLAIKAYMYCTHFARHFTFWPSSIREFSLDFISECPQNHDFPPTNLMDGNIEDPFSSSFRDFSQQLTFINLDNVVVGKELFWPINPKDSTPPPFWPHLTTIYLQYGIATPSGQWYFERDPADDTQPVGSDFDRDDDYPEYLQPPPEDHVVDIFRVNASPELMNEFYLSSGRAAQRMPQLKLMSLSTVEAMVYDSFRYEVDGNTAKATWNGNIPFKPDEGVLQAWREAAFQHTGKELEVELLKEGDHHL